MFCRPGSNRTLIGQWYGFDGVPWCAETVSYGLYNAGFNDGAGHITLAEPTTDRGWAYVPFLETAFRDAGAFDHAATTSASSSREKKD